MKCDGCEHACGYCPEGEYDIKNTKPSESPQMPHCGWRKGDDPPDTNPGKWSKDVVAITNYGDIYKIAYFGTKEDGCWQRVARFNDGEKVEFWIEKPEGF